MRKVNSKEKPGTKFGSRVSLDVMEFVSLGAKLKKAKAEVDVRLRGKGVTREQASAAYLPVATAGARALFQLAGSRDNEFDSVFPKSVLSIVAAKFAEDMFGKAAE